ncbi:GNAT family N-acetyltransferase [Kinneretia aquatilis]|uniref:GNAT family N-acetyltransferase n=1 Tax=Kinneretia aquatilis TaxID=2070761 RepID=UPI001495320A|nr:GNAT family N-acetyltransferase [Paucibacter aquatile]WIV98496.1 GNAT family N-acetyltransferase [Paucibacter aquatile]
MESPRITLITPDDAEAWSATREILRDYSASLQVDLCFQDFEAELASLPGQYEPPGGLMLLALVDGAVAGCGGFRNLPEVDYPNACEMKRLFVRPAFRRFGLGRLLAQALIDRATQAGYSSMLLDTLDDMEAARGLYESLGFEAVPPYYFNPIPGAHYLRVELA